MYTSQAAWEVLDERGLDWHQFVHIFRADFADRQDNCVDGNALEYLPMAADLNWYFTVGKYIFACIF